MAVPLILLYEIGILSAKIFGRPPARNVMDIEVDLPEGTAGKRVL